MSAATTAITATTPPATATPAEVVATRHSGVPRQQLTARSGPCGRLYVMRCARCRAALIDPA